MVVDEGAGGVRVSVAVTVDTRVEMTVDVAGSVTVTALSGLMWVMVVVDRGMALDLSRQWQAEEIRVSG